ncbi:hypothetical protein BDZ94DRAFT_1311474 [Collybia nuda]|uniref:Embryonic stem cell-specific 5-hydroxymethylcytosine-binding protein n=1 Tax=Collybia nuda TaxID=64659 RepID=A0A9P6CH17_9AGAR|nr:hypothetical protein BDZ94DRAFT_1311474 [Collybia nuda]
MCGRFSLRLPAHEIRQIPGHDDVDVDEWVDEDQFVPRYNIAPRTQGVVLRQHDPGPSDVINASGPQSKVLSITQPSAGKRNARSHYILQTMKWGLVPHWSKFEDKTLSTTNARSENLVEGGGMWASIKGRKRCAILCQGYYEWLNRGTDKLPHFTKHQDGKLMLMAGLYDCVVLEGETAPLWTFTIVTTLANSEFSWLHDRQPVILSTSVALHAWLDTSSHTWTPELTKLVEPYHDKTSPLECYKVPKEVGKVGTESPTFIEPVSNRKDGIRAMFSKQAQKHSEHVKFQLQNAKPAKPSSNAQVSTSRDLKPSNFSNSKRSRSPPETHDPFKSETTSSASKKLKLTKSQGPDSKITILSTPPPKSQTNPKIHSTVGPSLFSVIYSFPPQLYL